MDDQVLSSLVLCLNSLTASKECFINLKSQEFCSSIVFYYNTLFNDEEMVHNIEMLIIRMKKNVYEYANIEIDVEKLKEGDLNQKEYLLQLLFVYGMNSLKKNEFIRRIGDLSSKQQDLLYSLLQKLSCYNCQISFSLQWLESMPISGIPFDFCFNIGSETRYCYKIMASVLSKKVRELISTDPCSRVFSLLPTTNIESFDQVLGLLSGKNISITLQNWKYFYSIGMQLGIDSIIDSSMKIGRTILTPPLVIYGIIQETSDENETEIYYQYAAENIWDVLQTDQFKKMITPGPFLRILAHPSLGEYNHSCLFKILVGLFEQQCDEISNMLEYVDPSRLSQNDFKKYMSIFPLKIISNDLWKVFIDRISTFTNSFKSFSYDPHNQFNGIMHYLNPPKGNAALSHEIELFADCENDKCWILLEYSGSNMNSPWHGKSENDSAITFNFLEKKVGITGYLIRTSSPGKKRFPKAWIVYGSDDEKTWYILDKQKDAPLNDKYQVGVFSTNPQREYRLIRFQFTENWASNRGFPFVGISCIELFGDLFRKDEGQIKNKIIGLANEYQ